MPDDFLVERLLLLVAGQLVLANAELITKYGQLEMTAEILTGFSNEIKQRMSVVDSMPNLLDLSPQGKVS